MVDERQMSGWLCSIQVVDFISEPALFPKSMQLEWN